MTDQKLPIEEIITEEHKQNQAKDTEQQWQDDPNVEGSRAFNEANKEVIEEEQPKELTAQQKEYQEMQEFLSKEDNRQKALSLAEQLHTLSKGKWFSLNDVVKKSMESAQSAHQKIQLCKMFNLLITRIGDTNDPRPVLRQPLFKIVISNQDKIEGL